MPDKEELPPLHHTCTRCKTCGFVVLKNDTIRGSCLRCEIERLKEENKKLKKLLKEKRSAP